MILGPYLNNSSKKTASTYLRIRDIGQRLEMLFAVMIGQENLCRVLKDFTIYVDRDSNNFENVKIYAKSNSGTHLVIIIT